MRLVFVVNNYPPRVGGLESHVSHLARHLAEQGVEVEVHTLTDGAPGRSVEDGITVHRWREAFQIGGLLGFPTPAAALGIARALEGADLVSVHTRFFPLTWLGTAAARHWRIPVIHTEHGSGFVATSSPVMFLGSRAVDLTFGRWSLRHASAVVGVSEDVVAFVRRLAGVEATVFYNAIEPPVVRSAAAPRRHAVFVGRVVPGKGWQDFLAAVAAAGPDVTAEVMGEGSDLAELRRRVDALGLTERVAVRGRVPLAAVYDALEEAVLVNPTRLAEGFQTTLLEALAVGARIVTYPVPGADTLVAQGAAVTVVPRDVDALAAGLREALAEPSPAWDADQLAPWTWPVRTSEFLELSRRLVPGAPGAPTGA